MKKSALVLGALLMMAGGYAAAYPEVGDEGKWAGTYKEGTNPEKTVELTAKVISHDVADQEWDIQMDWTMDGQTKSEVEDIDEDKMWSEAMWTKVQSECVAKGGTLEDVTVPAGTFASCHMTKTWGPKTMEVWLAGVPFGIVKANKMDSVKMKELKMELQSFTAMPVPTPPEQPVPPTPTPEPELIF
ncbi:hypothetical protein AZI86_10115 [Bdellovibrio bacteriovorus]|uniref:DUF4412 domain-containing protein n=1 Tax=Bdellovibrio bacteriovorus TaxID=959 RepID=A0A150WS51_BDEBC|nr:hypothetical protein [Bdellovibrio bacteriovorus]KYG67341.1 hypothetical protein AZI86_10115 [Bdellovibrio bacteriovorus]